MNYIHSDLGLLPAGATVDVHLGNAANVCLVDSANLRRYRCRDSFRYIGGHYKCTPVTLRVPSQGHWHVVADLGGAPGRLSVRVSVRR